MKTNLETKLRNVLRGNAIFSGVNGIVLTMFPHVIAQWMGISESAILLYIGLGLILFSISLVVAASKTSINKKNIQFIIVQDWLWVIGSAIILAFQLFKLNNIGYWLVADVAIVVAVFAIFQSKYLKSIK